MLYDVVLEGNFFEGLHLQKIQTPSNIDQTITSISRPPKSKVQQLLQLRSQRREDKRIIAQALPFYRSTTESNEYLAGCKVGGKIFKETKQAAITTSCCLCPDNKNKQKQVMIHNFSSERELHTTIKNSPLNQEDNGSDTVSLKKISNRSDKESIASKGRILSRKPDSQGASFQTFQQVRRKSQQKIEKPNNQYRMEQPPLYPQKAKGELSTASLTRPSEGQSERESGSRGDSGVRFKKKAMSRQQIIEIKDYMRTLDKLETNSITASEKTPHEGSSDPLREANKKSKTQYFYFEECRGSHPLDIDIPENSSQTEKIQLASLQEKCKSVDHTNSLLSKRLQWLRQEIEMHLERQQQFKTQLSSLQKQFQDKQRELAQQTLKNQQLSKQLQYKAAQICKMRQFIVQLNTHFDNDREILVSEIEYLKSQKENEYEEQEKIYLERIQELEEKIERVKEDANEVHDSESKGQEAYFKSLVEKLANENKYLKMENHMLARYKEDVTKLKKENKQVLNERDTLKKKIIENAKKEALKMRMFEDSDSSSMNSLSELTYSLSHMLP